MVGVLKKGLREKMWTERLMRLLKDKRGWGDELTGGWVGHLLRREYDRRLGISSAPLATWHK